MQIELARQAFLKSQTPPRRVIEKASVDIFGGPDWIRTNDLTVISRAL